MEAGRKHRPWPWPVWKVQYWADGLWHPPHPSWGPAVNDVWGRPRTEPQGLTALEQRWFFQVRGQATPGRALQHCPRAPGTDTTQRGPGGRESGGTTLRPPQHMLAGHLLGPLAWAVLIPMVSLCLSHLLTPCRVFKALENPDPSPPLWIPGISPFPERLCWKLQQRVAHHI